LYPVFSNKIRTRGKGKSLLSLESGYDANHSVIGYLKFLKGFPTLKIDKSKNIGFSGTHEVLIFFGSREHLELAENNSTEPE